MKRCILHLGMPKTASTSIQATLLENRELLKTSGWEYPVFRCPQHGHVFFHHNDPLCRLFFEAHPFHAQRDVINGIIDLDVQKKGLFEALDHYCQSSAKLILSSEVLLMPQPLKRIKDYMHSRGYVIEPIVYVRSPYSYRVSLYQSFLKFSQFPAAMIVERLQNPLVRQAVQVPLEIFGDTVKFYPFNYLGRSGVDVVRHFLSHLLDDKECDSIIIKQDNKSLARQAASLLAYIEEKSPLYIDNVKSTMRNSGDINPLHWIVGEKFQFVPDQLALYSEVVDQENTWLDNNLGGEYCDVDYMNEVTLEKLVWGEKSVQSLLNVFPKMNIHIQCLISEYLKNQAVFTSPALQKKTFFSIRKELSLSRIRQFCFPVETKRGDLARKLYESLKS